MRKNMTINKRCIRKKYMKLGMIHRDWGKKWLSHRKIEIDIAIKQ